MAAIVAIVILSSATSQEKADEAQVTVAVHLSAEHAPEGLKMGVRADLMMVLGSVKAKKGKAMYQTKLLVSGATVVSIKREEKPVDPTRAVAVELSVPKAQAEKIEKAKTGFVDVVEFEGGKAVTKKRPIPLRLELPKPKG